MLLNAIFGKVKLEMNDMIPFISILITVCLFYFFCNEKKEQKTKEAIDVPSDSCENELFKNNLNMSDVSIIKTKELCLEELKNLNCQVSFDEEAPDSMLFNYQGENFMINANNECRMITIWDQFWYEVDLDNLEDVSMVRKAINSVNISIAPTLVYSFVEETHKMWVHTKLTALFDAEISDKQNYLRALFSGFFDAHRWLLAEIDRLKKEEN